MKRISFSLVYFLLLFSCRKQELPAVDRYWLSVKSDLQARLGETDFADLDFTKAARVNVDSARCYAIRIPFRGRRPDQDFVLVRTNAEGRVREGKIVQLRGQATVKKGEVVRSRWDGRVLLSSLDRKTVFESPVVNGVITCSHSQNRSRTDLQVPRFTNIFLAASQF